MSCMNWWGHRYLWLTCPLPCTFLLQNFLVSWPCLQFLLVNTIEFLYIDIVYTVSLSKILVFKYKLNPTIFVCTLYLYYKELELFSLTLQFLSQQILNLVRTKKQRALISTLTNYKCSLFIYRKNRWILACVTDIC